jgi:hypothetical protein
MKGLDMSEHNATFGFRTLKGFGSRLVRNITESPGGGHDADDWVNYMVKEGTSGWKKGLSFERAYAYQSKDADGNAHHLYRMLVTRQKGLEIVCIVFGRTSRAAWVAAYAMLHEKGLMPTDAYEAMLVSKGVIDE